MAGGYFGMSPRLRICVRFTHVAFVILAVVCALPSFAIAQQPPDSNQPCIADLTQMSIEDLMNIQVTSVSKKTEKLFDSSAAVYVISSEDIRRSGATSIPEALRMAPGLWVARIDSSKWIVSSRGFGERFSNKLLVLIDGRSVYTPLFSGVWWDAQDILMDDIDRIEVIRGPGATMWGANAVNGVINIITKSSKDTTGMLLTSLSGDDVRTVNDARYGGKIGDDTYFRVYAKDSDHLNFDDRSGPDTGNGWRQGRGGFRAEKYGSNGALFSLQADFYNGSGDQMLFSGPGFSTPALSNFTESGTNILARWSRNPSPASGSEMQIFYDRTERNDLEDNEQRDTYDFEYQRHFSIGGSHRIIWGAGYRYSKDIAQNTPVVSFSTPELDTHIANTFIQDDIVLRPDRAKLTIGSKLEHNSYTGIEVQPSIRFAWTPSEKKTVWVSVSRAVRTPSRFETDTTVNWTGYPGGGPLPWILRLYPNKDFESEDLIAYELGYRTEPSSRISLDLSTFFNVYDHYQTFEVIGAPFAEMTPIPRVIVPLQSDNKASAKTYGFEAALNWQANDRWKLSGGFTYLKVNTDTDAGSTDFILTRFDNNYPHHQFNIRSCYDISKQVEFDVAFYGESHADCIYSPINSLNRLDMRLGWHIRKDMDLSLCGQNLLKRQHLESFTTFLDVPGEVPSGFYGKLAYQF